MNKERTINKKRITRGGGWFDVAYNWAAYRIYGTDPVNRLGDLGFRSCRSVQGKKQLEKWREEAEEGLFDE